MWAVSEYGLIEETGKGSNEVVKKKGKFNYRIQSAVMYAFAYCYYKEIAMSLYKECGYSEDFKFLLQLALLYYKAKAHNEMEQYL